MCGIVLQILYGYFNVIIYEYIQKVTVYYIIIVEGYVGITSYVKILKFYCIEEKNKYIIFSLEYYLDCT